VSQLVEKVQESGAPYVKNHKGRVYVQGAFMNKTTARLFEDRGYLIEKDDPTESDVVVWTGGEDIHPKIYNEEILPGTYPNPNRDIKDVSVFNQVCNNQMLIGICRGAQLLNVLNGGSMWQDINNHGGVHHDVFDKITGERVTINSLHHQQMIINPNAGELIAYCQLATHKVKQHKRWVDSGLPDDPGVIDPEVIWYPRTASLCFQAHPEFGHEDTTKYFFRLVDRYRVK
jgi:gamma-glutamyl-gamma-aminobutyrate hydrolase PuuD